VIAGCSTAAHIKLYVVGSDPLSRESFNNGCQLCGQRSSANAHQPHSHKQGDYRTYIWYTPHSCNTTHMTPDSMCSSLPRTAKGTLQSYDQTHTS
jgi:hypothetical protein